MSQTGNNLITLDVWGGVESTVNRIHDRFFDQTIRTGHEQRITDLDLIADLGIRTLRYPVLWERTAPDGLERADWRWADERLERLQELQIRPIIGLLHHGSGPRDTNLLDPKFPERFAAYAGAVARRYPWVTDYTPVNEPLTTARFSALYGHWYPHRADDLSFAKALLAQTRATVLAMEAIRETTPDARLIQTEDVGKVFSTDELAYQAAFENERRWIAFDLLSGRLAPGDVMWQWLEFVGIAREELEWFRAHPCPPSLIGINTYLSSQRFLDHRVDLYPYETSGSNGMQPYVDVLAARVLPDDVVQVSTLLKEVWDRYGLPIAITEVHNGSSIDEQRRWLNEVWIAARQAKSQGIDIRAVTIWALFGSFDWDSLVTIDASHYEPGVFTVENGTPQPTELADMVRELVRHGSYEHPDLLTPGWWQREDRFYEHLSRELAGVHS